MALIANEDFQHILRVLKTNVDVKQKFMFSLPSIKGFGRRFSNIVNDDVDMNKRAGELSAAELENLTPVAANPPQFKISDWVLNRKKDYVDGRYSQVVSNALDMKLSDDLERQKKIRFGLAGAGNFKSMNFVQNTSKEDEQSLRKKNRDFVHVAMIRKNTFVTVTDAKGNKKIGASAGSLEERKGRSRLSRYAAEATAEHVGRSARKIGLKSVVMKVKGATYFRKKKKVILSWREGFRGEGAGAGVKSRILSIYDVTQLPHNGCRLPKKRRT